MKITQVPTLYELEDLEGATMADWKESPEHVLKIVDKQLAKHGLEVELFDDPGEDVFIWRIVPIYR